MIRDSQRKSLFNFLVTFTEDNHYPPSLREIGDALGWSSTSHVVYRLKDLEQAGWIERGRGARAISFVGHEVNISALVRPD